MRNIKYKWLCFFTIIIYSFSYSQDSISNKKNHILSIQSGYTRHFVLDDIISPNLYKGVQIPVRLDYQILKDRSFQSISLYFDYLKLKSSITISSPAEAFYSKNVNAFIKYDYYRKLYNFKKWNTSVFVGAEIKNLLNNRNHYYNNYIHYTTGELVSCIGPSFYIIKNFNQSPKHFLCFNFSMPIISFDWLNNYYNANVVKKINTESNQNTLWNTIKENRPVTINKYFDFQTELSYTRYINSRFGIELKHYFQYYKSEKFKKLFYTKSVNNQYLIGLVIKLK